MKNYLKKNINFNKLSQKLMSYLTCIYLPKINRVSGKGVALIPKSYSLDSRTTKMFKKDEI